ncbi:MAG: F0F1 ATP synthase subunit epsilon [Barnesiella sp.]|nr:F0F1 ATP synthase subunit epsilon [Barnesiella sp.]
MTLKIISAIEVLFEGEVEMVTLPGENGRFTVLNNHASLISTLVTGDIIYRHSAETSTTRIEGGIADVDNNLVSVCVY